MISHRAEIARNLVMRAELGIAPRDAYVAWSPLYHMGGAEYSLSTLTGLVGHIREEQDAPAMRSLWQAAGSAVPYSPPKGGDSP